MPVKPVSSEAPSLLSTNEAAKRLRISTRTLHRMKKRRQISYIKLNGVLRFERSAVESLIKRRTVQAA
jgi:excisionase family DNA binding protein